MDRKSEAQSIMILVPINAASVFALTGLGFCLSPLTALVYHLTEMNRLQMNPYETWLNHVSGVVDIDDFDQGVFQICWAIALNRNMNAIFKMRNIIGPQSSFSMYYLVFSLSQAGVLSHGYALPRLEDSMPFFLYQGNSISPSNDPTRYRLGHMNIHHRCIYPSTDSFEIALLTCLNTCPMAVGIPGFDSFLASRASPNFPNNEIYSPTLIEKIRTPLSSHLLLATGRGILNGRQFLECQDSGVGRTYVCIELGTNIFSQFVEMGDPYVIGDMLYD